MLTFRQYLAEIFVKKAGSQMGSNPGGIHTDSETGKEHYVKYYKNGNQAKSEALAGKIYHHMGISTIHPEHHMIDGKHAVVTPYNHHLEAMHGHDFKKLSKPQAHEVGKIYHAGVLTKNWDIVGLTHDNLMKHKKTGSIHSIDHGGAFNFRAQGGHKDYGSDIGEHKTLRHNDGASGQAFSDTFHHHPDAEHEGLKAVKHMDMDHIHHLFKHSGLDNHHEMHHNFVARRKALLAHYDKK